MDHLSSSQINLYLMCSLKYKFQYIDAIPKTFKPSALAFGSVIHSALSWIHNERMNGQDVSLEMLYKIFDSDWYCQKLESEIKFKDKEQELHLTLLGKELLHLYLQEPQKEAKGSEVHFKVPLMDPKTKERLGIDLEGFFDLIEVDDTIADFKTTAQTMHQDEVDAHQQLTAYGYAFNILFHKPPRSFKIVNLVKKKKPTIETLETKRTIKHYEGFFFLAKSVFRGIQAGIFVPRTGYWCKECEYAAICPLWSHKLEGLDEVNQKIIKK